MLTILLYTTELHRTLLATIAAKYNQLNAAINPDIADLVKDDQTATDKIYLATTNMVPSCKEQVNEQTEESDGDFSTTIARYSLL